jgi:hypothetical protein
MKHLCLAPLPLLAANALAQTNVLDAHKSSWQENCGWMNWRDAGTPAGQSGVFLDAAGGFLSGLIWCENIGWINVGNGGGPYANTTGTNFGVNVNTTTGELTGMAWGENIGWINFSGGAQATPANPARIEFGPDWLLGYAWSENAGWINLDHPTHYVAFDLPACDSIDFNNDGVSPDTQDLVDFLSVFGGGACSNDPLCNDIDFNNDGVAPDTEDIDDFLSVFGGGDC